MGLGISHRPIRETPIAIVDFETTGLSAGAVIQQFTGDQQLDDKEAGRLRRLHQCLSKLGWAPGE